ncbi:MAG: glycosyltransferase [Pseudomonadota bacterium]
MKEPVALSVVIPVLNEAENVVSLFHEIETMAKTCASNWEAVFVNDASRDQTAQVLADLKTQYPENVRVIQHRKQLGQSAGIYTGVKSSRYDWVATLDGDGQNNPADIPALLQQAQSIFNENSVTKILMVGHRNKRQDTLLKRWSSKAANAIRQRLLRDKTPDTGCGLKVFRRDDFLELPFFNHMHRFIPALYLRMGGVVYSTPVSHRHRTHGTSKYGFWNRFWVGIVDILGVVWLIRRGVVLDYHENKNNSLDSIVNDPSTLAQERISA